MEQNGVEGFLPHLLIAGENHTDYPEENDIIAGYQDIGGIEVVQIFGLIRPSQGRERPQCRGEPGVQGIRVLGKVGLATLRTNLGHLLRYHDFTTIVTVVSGNPVSPPKLTADTPVADIVSPVKVGLVHTLGNQLDFAILYSFYRRFNQLIHLHKPLLFYQRLNGGLATVMGAYIMGIVFNFYKQPQLIHLFDDGFSCLVSVHAIELSTVFVDGGIIVHNVDDGQIVALSYLKVVGVMCRGDLYDTSSKFHVNVGIFYDGNRFVHDRKPYLASF